MHDINILLSSGGSGGVAGIINHFYKMKNPRIRVHISDMAEDSVFKNFVDSYNKVPPINHPEYHSAVLELCKKRDIKVVFPSIADDVLFYAKNIHEFQKIGVAPTVSSYKASNLAIDKVEAYKVLRANGISVPEFYEIQNLAEFKTALKKLGYPENPICFKPARYPNGSGKGFRIIHPKINTSRRMFYELTSEMYYVTYDAVIKAMEEEKNFPSLMVMEYLPHEEYSVYCFCNNGSAAYIVPNLRLKLDQMTTNTAEVVKNDDIIQTSSKICEIFGFEYNVNIQIKYSKDRIPKVVEINPRIAGTILLPVVAGVDMLSLAILKAIGKEYSRDLIVKYGIRIKRYWKEQFEINGKMYEYSSTKVVKI